MIELKNVVITGGAGFIGSNLTLTLQQKFPTAALTVIDDFRSGDFKNLEGYRGDLITGDVSTLELKKYFKGRKVDALFHLASITDTTEHDQLKQNHDNIEGWRNLLDFFAGKRTRIMFASSAATYGISAGLNTLGQAQKPANVYAFSKVQLENLARIFVQENPKQTVVGLRYFNVYGAREKHKKAAASMMHQLAQQMRAGQKPRIFKFGEQKRDFVYVKDIVRYTLAAVLGVQGSGIYNAGSGLARSFNDVIMNLNRVLGLALETDYIENPYAFYQPHTEADQSETIKSLKLKAIYDLEKGLDDYFKSGWLTA